MTNNRVAIVALLLMSSFLFTECKRTTKDDALVGPEVVSASSSFYVVNNSVGNFVPYQYRPDKKTHTTLSTPSGSVKGKADFINYINTYFKAKFSETANWTIEITGLTSKAKKYISGYSDTIGQHNSTWYGESTGIPFFIDQELAVAKLIVPGFSKEYTDTILINQAKTYDGQVFNGIYHILLDDFENQSLAGRPFGTVSTDAFDKVDYFPSTKIKVQGAQSIYLSGTDVNWNGYMIAKTTVEINKIFKGLPTNPDSLYFNLYIYGTGATSTTISLELFENEHPGLPYSLAANDGWIYDVIIDWMGWKLVSIPYSNFKKAPNPTSGGNGNGVKEPHLISGASITLNSYPVAGKTINTYVDFATLTTGGPFKP